MRSELFSRRPTRRELGREIADTAKYARRLRSLYRVVCRIESESDTKHQPDRQTDNDRQDVHRG